MRSLIEKIALENFRSSGFISRPDSGGARDWEYMAPPRIPVASRDALQLMIQRRERAALSRKFNKTSILRHRLNAFFHR